MSLFCLPSGIIADGFRTTCGYPDACCWHEANSTIVTRLTQRFTSSLVSWCSLGSVENLLRQLILLFMAHSCTKYPSIPGRWENACKAPFDHLRHETCGTPVPDPCETLTNHVVAKRRGFRVHIWPSPYGHHVSFSAETS